MKKPVKNATARKSSAPRKAAANKKTGGGFTEAFAELLRSRSLDVPEGLVDAPPDAYASQPVSFIEHLSRYPDGDLVRFAEQVAGYARRQAQRAEAEWEQSPLIGELRRRRLKEPPRPLKPSGVSVSLTKPLTEWSDADLLKAAQRWSKLGR